MLQREIDPAQAADIAKFEAQLERYLAGELDEDVFRVFRLNNGIYGQRQGGHNQMVRVKAPYGSITAEQLDMLAHITETFSRKVAALKAHVSQTGQRQDLEEMLRTWSAGTASRFGLPDGRLAEAFRVISIA